MATVFKSIFTSIILALFYPSAEWLQELTDMDHMVDNNTINLAEVGADPEVFEDNAVWPLVAKQRTDKGIVIPLHTYDTEPIHVTNVEELETNYKKAESVSRQHINVLRTRAATSAAYNIAPNSHTSTTPVLKTTGTTKADGTRALTFDDILDLQTAFDDAELPQEGRIILLSPTHKSDLKKEDKKLFKEIMQEKEIYGFKIYTFTRNPKYDPANGTKLPYGAANGNTSSIAFVKTEVMRAMGDVKGEPEYNWALYRGWILGYQMRFVAMPFRAYGVSAIYSAAG